MRTYQSAPMVEVVIWSAMVAELVVVRWKSPADRREDGQGRGAYNTEGLAQRARTLVVCPVTKSVIRRSGAANALQAACAALALAL